MPGRRFFFTPFIIPHRSSHRNPTLDARKRIFNIPGTLHPRFSGRQKYLAQIEAAFRRKLPEQRPIVSVFGMPGLGKSQLCLKYVTDHRGDYDYAFYASAGTTESWYQSCDEIIRILKLPDLGWEDHSQKVAALREWLAATSGWMLVIDDIWDCAVDAVRKTLPSYLGGHVLFSTRDKHIAEDFSGEDNSIALKEMDANEGKELVLKIYRQHGNGHGNGADEDVQTLAENINQALGGLPLALEQGTTSAKRMHWKLGDLLKNLQENKQSVIRDTAQSNLHHADIITTLTIALGGLEPHHVAILNIILMMRPQGLPMELLIEGGAHVRDITLNEGAAPSVSVADTRGVAGSLGGEKKKKRWVRKLWKWSKWRPKDPTGSLSSAPSSSLVAAPAESHITETAGTGDGTSAQTFSSMRRALQSKEELEGAIVVMEKTSLIRRGEGGEIWVHDLIREVLLERLEEQERREYLLYAIQIIRWAFPYTEGGEKIAKARLYMPHSTEVYKSMKSQKLVNDDRTKVGRLIALFFFEDGRYDDAIASFEEVLEDMNAQLSYNSIIVIWDIAACYQRKNDLKRSMEFFDRAVGGVQSLEERGKVVDQIWKCDIFRERAFALGKLGRFKEASELNAKVIAELEAMEPSSYRDRTLLSAVRTAGLVHFWQGDYGNALEHHERALKGWEGQPKKNNYWVMVACSAAADASRLLGQFEKALRYGQQSLRLAQEIYGDNHPEWAGTLLTTGLIHSDKGEYDKALQCFEQVIPIYEMAYGKDHRWTKQVVQYAQEAQSKLSV
ncbi:hypothetical protein TWF481_011475 [Arthrobotrys musiformis]|uniref:NB-ARC domain-containing protein n=1 Tax=Arthrobotrys musiformis TaxID=47236 RepID=A0AAV9W0W9_9PEZI